MVKTNQKRQTRSDKFPLTLHKTGQFCKKIKGKLYYFGSDKEIAFQRYLEQATYLHTGKASPPRLSNDLSLKTLCNLYLDHQESRTKIGEIKLRHLHDQIVLLRDFAKFIGANRLVSRISIVDLQSYRRKLIKDDLAPNTINNRMAAVKAVYNWAIDNEIIDVIPRLRAVRKIPRHRKKEPTFSIPQINKLLLNANIQMKAMIWLGLNCGFGCTDCSELLWKHVCTSSAKMRQFCL